MIRTDLTGLLASTAGEIFAALDLAGQHQEEKGERIELQVTGIRLDLPVILEYVPGRAGGPRVPGRFRVRPPSIYPVRRARRPGRLRMVWTAREEPSDGR